MRSFEFLKELAKQQKLSHAYLFSGNDEASKEEMIRDLLDILSVREADRMVVEPNRPEGSREITIGQMRTLTAFLSMSPWNSPYKAAIIREAHTMNTEAQSAFLKLLEEPKGNAVLFLRASRADMLLDTIRSRAQEFKFYSFDLPVLAGPRADEFQKLRKANLIVRFGEAKRLAEAPEQLPAVLYAWMREARRMLLYALKENPQSAKTLAATLGTMQETAHLLETTNVNPRLAIERVMLDL